MTPVTYKPAGHHARHQASQPAHRPLGAGDAAPIMVRTDDGRLASLADIDPRTFGPLRDRGSADRVVGGSPAVLSPVHVPSRGLGACTAPLMDGVVPHGEFDRSTDCGVVE